eukprot:scaffold1344_cov388-Prasinococcus_capsulatus_cf.AAC.11
MAVGGADHTGGGGVRLALDGVLEQGRGGYPRCYAVDPNAVLRPLTRQTLRQLHHSRLLDGIQERTITTRLLA